MPQVADWAGRGGFPRTGAITVDSGMRCWAKGRWPFIRAGWTEATMLVPTLLQLRRGTVPGLQGVFSGLAAMGCASLMGGAAPVCAQAIEPPTPEEVEAARSAPLFASNEILAVTLEADFFTMRREDRKDEDSQDRPAILHWNDTDGTPETLEIQVRTRGDFRLSVRNCDFPPLRLRIDPESASGTIFEGQEKLKLVGVCKVKQDYWEQYVVAEYLIYRTFNLFTDLSFRVRPLRVTYVDKSQEDDTFTRLAFVIEDDSQMAARNGGRIHEWERGQLDPRLLEQDQAILVDIFQYMIGNTDWSGVEMHNMELFRYPNGRPSTVPYDFDFSGVVDARYAVPDPQFRIHSVRDRLFRGFCPDQVNRRPERYEAAFDRFREARADIYELWRTQEGLSQDKLRDTLKYFDDFFEILDDPEAIDNYMMRDCRRVHKE